MMTEGYKRWLEEQAAKLDGKVLEHLAFEAEIDEILEEIREEQEQRQ